MKYWILPSGKYYFGQYVADGSVEITSAQYEAKMAEVAIIEAAKAELLLIDAASVRAIREYIASKADAPQILKDKEADAIVARAKLK